MAAVSLTNRSPPERVLSPWIVSAIKGTVTIAMIREAPTKSLVVIEAKEDIV